jgi:hypothetical protein
MMIVDLAASQKEVTGPAESRFYIIHGEQVAWKDVATVLAKTLHSKGVLSDAEPRSVPIEQAGEGEILTLLGSNMFVKGDRANKLGFHPKEKSILEHIPVDFESYEF